MDMPRHLTDVDGAGINAQLGESVNHIKPSYSVWEEFEQREVNVKWFGAKGDYNTTTSAGTDDTTFIQNAINFAETYGGTVVFPKGNYYITSTLLMSANARYLKGLGKVFLTYNGAIGTYAISSKTGAGFTYGILKDIIINLPTTKDRHGVDVNYMRYSLFDNVMISNADIGLNLDYCFGSHFTNCKQYTSKIGINCLNNINGVSFSYNVSESNAVGAFISGRNLVFDSACIFEKNDVAVSLSNVILTDITNCYFEANKVDFAYTNPAASSRQFNVHSNHFSGVGDNIVLMNTTATANEMKISLADNLFNKTLTGYIINKTTTSPDEIKYVNNKLYNQTHLGIVNGDIRYDKLKSDGSIKFIPVLSGTWTSDVNNPIEVFIDSEGYVNLKGTVTTGDIEQLFINLPAMMCPKSHLKFPVAHGSSLSLTTLAQVSVRTEGEVAIRGATSLVYLNGIKWKR
jgi:hypothetical protein